VVAGLLATGADAQTQTVISVPTLELPKPFLPLQQYGPYNARILAGGRGLTKELPAKDPVLEASASWTISAWIEVAPASAWSVAIAGVGELTADDSRYFVLIDGKPAVQFGRGELIAADAALTLGIWHLWAATFDGIMAHFYLDGVDRGSRRVEAGAVAPQLTMGPVQPVCAKPPCPHFGGRIAEFTLARGARTSTEVARLARERPDPELIEFEEGSKPWPIQVVQYTGNLAPQEPWTMPQRKAPFSKPKARPLPPAKTTLVEESPADWTLSEGWKLAAAPDVSASSKAISTVGFDASAWMAATVPGTVLTTMIDRGIFPDPDFGLNNLDIPEKLSRQDYWYRAEFASPNTAGRPHVSLVLDGINYRAEVWFNGELLGQMAGAFTRGVFDVSQRLHAGGSNAIAIRISPPPHPGIPNVQSIILGSGLNGGAMELDGPTFMASEGWDWNPPMHDRDTGLWQSVHLVANGPVAIGDEQVITHLPLPDVTQADITLKVPLENASGKTIEGTLTAAFEGVELRRGVTVPPGGVVVQLAPTEFAALHLDHPRLWWPNGYGKPELYHLTTMFTTAGAAPTVKKLRFGVREVSYQISLLDGQGALRRVEYDPTLGREEPTPQVDVRHEGMRQVPDGWAASIASGKEASPVFHAVEDTRATPYLTIKVNGLRIAVRGGSWGMDDSRKRVSRERLEPFFRYDRDANLNIIRNWQGQNSEEVFYDLADEYGMLVWNDFWEVTTDSNIEAEDPQLFLANARDTILRYRNHPSIAIWCGRNEGVPQPVINEGLIALTHSLDGTRYYSPSSNQVNLQTSGPYSYQEPAAYYTKLDRGFAVEVGTSSLPTREWFDRWLPKEDLWPIDDDWAYHNWHPYDEMNRHMEAQFGMASGLDEYVRRAQMMNYVDYRAIFEGFNAHLWAPNSGRLLWMTQPSWPSMLWGILTSDYDTQASYYATKKACEPVHVQLDLATSDVQVINTTRDPLKQAKVDADVYALDGKLVLHRDALMDAATDDVTTALHLDLAPLLGETTVLVRLALHGGNGTLLSENLYWRAASDAGYRKLDEIAQATVKVVVGWTKSVDGQKLELMLRNTGQVAALNTKLATMKLADGSEVLPAFYSDNYISLLPGEERAVTVDLPGVKGDEPLRIKVNGWNVPAASVEVTR
jgi:beta-galactosidase/beta-glucuronidase